MVMDRDNLSARKLDDNLILHQTLMIALQGNVRQLVRRITNPIFKVTGLRDLCVHF